jgi:hypothetical protein
MHVHTLKLCMHNHVIIFRLYKIAHIYFFAQNNCYALISILLVNKS